MKFDILWGYWEFIGAKIADSYAKKRKIAQCENRRFLVAFSYFLMAYCTTSDLIIYVFPWHTWHTCHKIQFNRYMVVISKEKETLLTLIEGKSSIFEFPFTMKCFLYDVGKIFKKFSRFIVARWTLSRSFNCIELTFLNANELNIVA